MRPPLERALTLKEPWAWLVAHGIKRFEFRSWWPAEPPGWILLHAGAARAPALLVESVRERLTPSELALFDAALSAGLPQSAFVGAGLVNWCIGYPDVENDQRRWFPDSEKVQTREQMHLNPWFVEEALLLPFESFPAKGKLNLWRPLPSDRARALELLPHVSLSETELLPSAESLPVADKEGK